MTKPTKRLLARCRCPTKTAPTPPQPATLSTQAEHLPPVRPVCLLPQALSLLLQALTQELGQPWLALTIGQTNQAATANFQVGLPVLFSSCNAKPREHPSLETEHDLLVGQPTFFAHMQLLPAL